VHSEHGRIPELTLTILVRECTSSSLERARLASFDCVELNGAQALMSAKQHKRRSENQSVEGRIVRAMRERYARYGYSQQ
jgi:hypothetical protein